MEPKASDLVQQGIAALRAGDKAAARQLLMRAADLVPRNQNVWLWLSDALESAAEQRACLEQVVAIDPQNKAGQIAQRKLEKLAETAAPPEIQRQPREEFPQLPPEESSPWQVGSLPAWQEPQESPWEESQHTGWGDKPSSWQDRFLWLKQPHSPVFWMSMGVAIVVVLGLFVGGLAFALLSSTGMRTSAQLTVTPTDIPILTPVAQYPIGAPIVGVGQSSPTQTAYSLPTYAPGVSSGGNPYPGLGVPPPTAPVVPPIQRPPNGFYPAPESTTALLPMQPTSVFPTLPSATLSPLPRATLPPVVTPVPTTELPASPTEAATLAPLPIPPEDEEATATPLLPSEEATTTPSLPSEEATTTPLLPSEEATMTPSSESETPTETQLGLRATPVPMPYPEEVFVRSSRGFVLEEGSYVIAGEVLNNTSSAIWFAVVEGSVYDTNDMMIMSLNAEIVPPRTDPQERAGFRLVFDGVTDVARYELKVNYDSESSQEDFRALTVLSRNADTSLAPELEITGEIRNDTDQTLEVREVIATLYDEDNEVVDVLLDGFADDSELAPGATTPYTIISSEAPEFTEVQVRAQGLVVNSS